MRFFMSDRKNGMENSEKQKQVERKTGHFRKSNYGKNQPEPKKTSVVAVPGRWSRDHSGLVKPTRNA